MFEGGSFSHQQLSPYHAQSYIVYTIPTSQVRNLRVSSKNSDQYHQFQFSKYFELFQVTCLYSRCRFIAKIQ